MTRQPDALGQIVQQRGLAHARVAAYHQDLALPGADSAEKAVEGGAFAVPVGQRGRAALPTGLWRHPGLQVPPVSGATA
jgi:hypothetical protein